MRYCILLLLCGLTISSTAQHSNVNLKKSIDEIGGLFKKKKKDSAVVQGGGPQSVVGVGHAGELAPGAKNIDADALFPFNAGSAMLRKGSATGLIDAGGNFIIPYNAMRLAGIYVVDHLGYQVYYNGMYSFLDDGKVMGGYVNSRGKIIATWGGSISAGPVNFAENKLALEQNRSVRDAVQYTYWMADGKSYTLNARLELIVDGIGVVRQTPAKPGNRYVRVTGEVLPGVYDDVAAFSDGMARVGKRDQFGVMKYGFIDRQGNVVIPLMFSVPPSDFSGGYARVQPADKSGFEYAFINKKGEIVFKQTLADIAKNGRFDHFTNFGMAFNDKAVLDSNFHVTTKGDFFKSFGLPADSWLLYGENYTLGESNPKLVYSTRTARSPYTQQPVYGFIVLKTRTVIAPVFDVRNVNNIYFDPVSRLAYAQVCTGRDIHNVPVYREGYINEDGLFVLVKGSGSTW